MSTKEGLQIDFADYCPVLKREYPSKPVTLFFETEDDAIIASEIVCAYGGIAGVEKRSDSGFLVRILPDRILATCQGCGELPGGFEETVEADA